MIRRAYIMKINIKKKLSVLLAAIVSLTCLTGALAASADDVIAINAQNFPDDVFRAAVQENYDKDADGFLSASERNVTSMPLIVLAMGEVKDLKGIEYFTSLTSLYAADLGIETADLSALTNLQSLRINGNELTSLDVSKNTALTDLNCRGNSKLTSLVLSPSVQKLQCDECALSALDVSMCSQLNFLNCYGNRLTSLNLSANPQLAELNCSMNRLTELDLSANTLLQNNITDYNIGSQSIDVEASTDGKNIFVPVNISSPDRIVSTSLTNEGEGYVADSKAFVFTEYEAVQNGIEYSYNTNCAGAESMSVRINTSKDFFKVTYFDEMGGNEVDYMFVMNGQDSTAPSFPSAPEGYVCPQWSDDGKNITADIEIYTIWSQEHSYVLNSFENDKAFVVCSVCGGTAEFDFADSINKSQGEEGYEEFFDVDNNGVINIRDYTILLTEY